MTLRELSQLYWLNREIEMDNERLQTLELEISEDRARLVDMERRFTTVSPVELDGMPRSGNTDRGVETKAVILADLHAMIDRKCTTRRILVRLIAQKQALCLLERDRLEQYIAGIPDSLLRMIFTYRFINGLSWRQVSESIGVRTTEESVKKLCYRYLDEEQNREP